tara:strand:- start:1095 stop:1220 length:126 start_codon:yes stop_codon:yes gene_type:complete
MTFSCILLSSTDSSPQEEIRAIKKPKKNRVEFFIEVIYFNG